MCVLCTLRRGLLQEDAEEMQHLGPGEARVGETGKTLTLSLQIRAQAQIGQVSNHSVGDVDVASPPIRVR